ncbi:MAG: VanZ family protein [Brevibacterium sp.]|uniref:VanZ family protein n=1 Tax=unclassified Brevibacterium TaxID=2614124 RepID=UPI001E436FC7|nr:MULTISPECIES: VanZ family protein [unclassified Brevibacterium]MDK8433677.1 VanZ family protein [Brevibacterium sp. H-BE7]
MTGRDRRMGNAPLIMLIFYTLFIAFVTLTPQQLDTGPYGPIGRLLEFFASHSATEWLTYSRVEKLANVGMFIPFGLLLALHLGRSRWWLGGVVGAGFSAAIEIFQGTVLTQTRFATISDLVTNTIGSGIGAALGLLVMVLLPPKQEEDRPPDRVVR